MIRKIQKNNIVKIILMLFVCAIIIFLYHMGGFATLFTEYSEEFTYKKFSTIFVGQKIQDVHAILGQPFMGPSDQTSCDWYSKPSEFWSILGVTDYTGWISVGVCYDKDGSVNGTAQNTFFN